MTKNGKTGSASSVPVPTGSTHLLVSDGTDTTIGIMQKGYNSISDSNAPYLAVAGDQLICSTNVNPFTVNLPASPSVGDEVTIIEAIKREIYGRKNGVFFVTPRKKDNPFIEKLL